MENVVEKLGFFDFLNLIFVGLYTIVGCFIIAYQFGWDISNNILTYLVNTTEVNALFLILCIFSLISISYIVGMVCDACNQLTLTRTICPNPECKHEYLYMGYDVPEDTLLKMQKVNSESFFECDSLFQYKNIVNMTVQNGKLRTECPCCHWI